MVKPLTCRELPRWERPREKLMVLGPRGLTEAELLAILLRVGRRGENVVSMCQRLLKDGLGALADRSVRELRRVRGIGLVKAIQVAAAFELAKRVAEDASRPRGRISSADDIAKLYIKKLAGLKQERFVAVFLDTRNRIISEKEISVGTLDASLIHPRDLFLKAVRESAASIILIHNHPSGDPEPSAEDVSVTKQLKKAANIMGIRFLDHIVVGSDSYRSVFDCMG